MAKTFFIVLAAALVVAALAFELNDDFEDEAADVEFMKRDPGMQEYLMAEKRGRNLKKYKCEYRLLKPLRLPKLQYLSCGLVDRSPDCETQGTGIESLPQHFQIVYLH